MTPLDPESSDVERLAPVLEALNAPAPHARLPVRILAAMREALRARVALLYAYDGERRRLVLESVRGRRSPQAVGSVLELGEGVAGRAARRRRALRVTREQAEAIDWRVEAQSGVEPAAALAVSLRHRGEVVGVAELVGPRGRDAFDAHDARLAEAAADALAAAVGMREARRRADRVELEYALFRRVSHALGRTTTLDEALRVILDNLRRLIDFDAAAVFALDRRERTIVSMTHRGYPAGADERMRLKIDEGIVGLAATHRRSIVVDDVRSHPRYVPARRRTRSEMVAPLVTGGRVIGVFNVESDRPAAFSRTDLRLLESFADKAAVSIERAMLYEEQREKREMEDELRVARTVQTFFSPRHARTVGPFRIAGVNYPSLEVSGDYYDVFPVRGGQMAFAIADVAGKGVPAAIIMASVRATLHTVAPYLTSARQIALRANRILRETVRPQDFVTAFIGVIDPETGELTYCNAGHNPPFLLDREGGVRRLESGGPVLGVFEDPPMIEGRLRLRDEVLVCYTDGALDARREDDTEFGEERFLEALRRHAALPPQRLGRALYRDIRAFCGERRPIDDITFLIARGSRRRARAAGAPGDGAPASPDRRKPARGA